MRLQTSYFRALLFGSMALVRQQVEYFCRYRNVTEPYIVLLRFTIPFIDDWSRKLNIIREPQK